MGLLTKLNEKVDRLAHFDLRYAETSSKSQTKLGPSDVYRYRKMRGVNLGSWFSLEPWIVKEPYRCAVGVKASDLDVAKGMNAQETLEEHWDTWIQEEDWEWLAARGINTVRIPIGYFHLSGPCGTNVLEGTDYDGFGDVYSSAYSYLKRGIEAAGKHGIGVLVDLHAAAGGQNRDSHCGTSTGQINFWSSEKNQKATLVALQYLVKHLSKYPNVVGLELLNEPANNDQIQSWYETTIQSLRTAHPNFPLYISDAWDLPWYAKFVGERSDFVVVDHHLYRSFTEDDHQKSGDEHAAILKSDTLPFMKAMSDIARGNLIVGEWSAALHPSSLRSNEAGEQDRQRRVFVRAQLDLFEATCAGWFFWTYKLKTGWNAGWSFRDATRAEILPSFFGQTRTRITKRDDAKKEAALRTALSESGDAES
ncbi:Glucan 1,3-beta-glucosidase 3 [Tulasnella sp. 419]|nr:Glucan 1,3-beta-glucosidase 3 [Tulasnella sp. 419]